MSAIFSPIQPQCIIAGTKAGQIIMWDMRVGQNPILNRPPSKKTHTYPIYSLISIDQNSSLDIGLQQLISPRSSSSSSSFNDQQNLASLSSDGKLCIWSMKNLNEPIDIYDIQSNSRALEVTSMAIPSYSSNMFVVGDEEGTISISNAHKKMIVSKEKPEGNHHSAPVLGLDFHPSSPTSSFDSLSRLFLSCSADWTIKLWTASKSQNQSKLLHTFNDSDSGDYIFDVRWSPVHPATFATADGQGRCCLWDLSRNMESPIETTVCGNPLTCIHWNNSGSQIAAGDSIGNIHIFSVGERWANPKADDWSSMEELCRKLSS